MNGWIWPGAVAVVVAASTGAAVLFPVQPLPEPPVSSVERRMSVVCPSFASVTADVRVTAASAGSGLQVAKVVEPEKAKDVTGLSVTDSPGAALRVSGVLPGPFGASTVVAAGAGGDRGLSATICGVPSTSHWFTGVDISASAQSEVVVANLDQTSASVDLTGYGREGKFAAPRGIEVGPNSVQTISLGTLTRNPGPVTVEVGSSDGRVAAFVRQRTWAGKVPQGTDWLARTVSPAKDLVVPGLPAGAGARTLVVTNPGERTASVTITGLTSSGPGSLADAASLDVPAGSTRTIDLKLGLNGHQAALKLSSTRPISAGVQLDSGKDGASHDTAYASATAPLPNDSLWPLAMGKDATSLLQLANPGDAEAKVTLTAGTTTEGGMPKEVVIPANSIVSVDLARSASSLVRIQTGETQLRAAVISTANLGKVRGLAVVGLARGESRGTNATVVYDPHSGS